MRTFWATATGALVGIAGGIWGVVFAVGIGLLVDLVLADLRVQRHSRALVSGDEVPPWLPVALPVAGAVAGAVIPSRLLVPSFFTEIEGRLASYRPNRFTRRLCERAVEAGAERGLSVEEAAGLLAHSLTLHERCSLTRAVWEALSTAPIPERPFHELRRLALLAGVSQGFADRELAVRSWLDPQACEILGVGTDASPDQIRRAYRMLAAQFHPDTASELNERQRQESAEAFIRVREAYDRLMGQVEE